MARIVVEHPETGQRIAVDEDAFDDVEAHPQNHDHIDYATTPFGNDPVTSTPHAGRQGDQRRSLKDDGYIPVAYQDDRSRETPIGEPITDQEREAMTREEQRERQERHIKLLQQQRSKKA